MLNHYSESQKKHLFELLHVYKFAVQEGKFSRAQVGNLLQLRPQLVEGRWYGELKRTQKYGAQYDWKTMLNAEVVAKLQAGDRSTDKIDRLLHAFQFENPQTQDVLKMFCQTTETACAVAPDNASCSHLEPAETIDLFGLSMF